MIDYIRIARPDHWFKNIFMVPGIVLALILAPVEVSQIWVAVLIGIASTCLVASANYTINEYLDAEFDRHHPTKKSRPGASGRLRADVVVIQYIVLSVLGLAMAYSVSLPFLYASIALLVMGILYNVKPFRTKDRTYLDVLSESINNPLRLLLGWFTVASVSFPPSSILISYWMGGAFLMAIKRFSEYRNIGDPAIAGTYRRSFKFYTEESLLISAFFYALTSVFFLGIFLIKYRIEFLLTFPMFALLFAWYLSLGLRENSPTQTPENLYKERGFVFYVFVLAIVVLILFFVDIPMLNVLLNPIHYAP